MRLIFKMIVICIVVAGLTGYGGYLMTGRPVWDLVSLPKMPKFEGVSKPALPGSADGFDRVYKWTDAEGVLHYSSEPPADEILAEELNINSNTNVVSAVEPQRDEPEPQAKPEAPAEQNEVAPPLYTPEGVKQVMEDAKDVQRLLNERMESQRKALDNL